MLVAGLVMQPEVMMLSSSPVGRVNLRLPGHGNSKAPNAALQFVGGVASQVMCSATVGCHRRIRSCLGLLIEAPVV